MKSTTSFGFRKAAAVFCAALLGGALMIPASRAQQPAQPAPFPTTQEQTAPLPAAQLDTLVAPVALYPDPLLSEVLAASTYPLEVVEAGQWLQRNANLQGQQLIDAAKQQNWDPSIQALVAFPDAMKLLTSDVQWTTALGNAFLGQQADVMAAVQRMRARAEANGRLATTPQQVVTTDTQDGQSAIEIQPANPQVVYVPEYSPYYVWGAPPWDYYNDLWYPGFGFGFGFGPGIYIGSFFPGWGGWGGWGWGFGWFGGGLFVNTGFFGHYGFHGYGGFRGGFFGGGRTAWAHDPGHRMGVPYANRSVATRFNSNNFVGAQRSGSGQRGAGNWSRVGQSGATRQQGQASSGWRGVGTGGSSARGGQSFSGSRSQGLAQAPRTQGFSQASRAQNFSATRSQGAVAPRQSMAAPRQSFSAPRQNFSAPRQNFSAPRQSFSAPRQSFSAPRQSFSAPRSSGGGGSFGGGSRGFSGGGGGGHPSGGGGGGGRRR